jgi:hypothetical protein
MFDKLAESLKAHQLYLEYYADWLGEEPPYKYLVLGTNGNHLAYGNTLAEIKAAVAHLI